MGTGNITKTDLYHLHNYVQNTLVTYSKNVIIEVLREFFSKDSYYHYQRDPWGFPKIPDHTNLDPRAGLHDDITTRLFIGEKYRYDGIYYPAVLVSNGGFRSVPISFNREKGCVQWTAIRYSDGYDNETIVPFPSHFIQAGAWEGSINIEIQSRGHTSRDELVDIISLALTDTLVDDLIKSGILIKNLNGGSPSEGEDRNDKLFKQTISFDTRSEWRRHIPIENTIELIHFCADIGNILNSSIAEGLSINFTLPIEDNE